MCLQGRAAVDVGKDGMSFESGPFTYFGLPAICGKRHCLTARLLCAPLMNIRMIKVVFVCEHDSMHPEFKRIYLFCYVSKHQLTRALMYYFIQVRRQQR